MRLLADNRLHTQRFMRRATELEEHDRLEVLDGKDALFETSNAMLRREVLRLPSAIQPG